MLKRLSSMSGSIFGRVTTATVLSLLLAITASAYTLVFRDGRRIDIPENFTVTRTTLTYEISPGFSRTVQVAVIDIAATERANREPTGSFFGRGQKPAVVEDQPTAPARRTVTNFDLAAVRQRRLDSEQAYEKRRQDLGLPTVAESRKRQEEENTMLREQFRADSASRVREEAYWRGRARDLRTEIAAVDTQIGYVRGRIGEVNEASLANRSWTTGIYPINPGWGNGRWGRQRSARPIYPGMPNPYGYPGGYGGYGYPGVYGYPGGVYPTGPFDNFNNSYQQSELTTRLDDLQVRRAGLLVQWQALENEARDARIPQVWLEP